MTEQEDNFLLLLSLFDVADYIDQTYLSDNLPESVQHLEVEILEWFNKLARENYIEIDNRGQKHAHYGYTIQAKGKIYRDKLRAKLSAEVQEKERLARINEKDEKIKDKTLVKFRWDKAAVIVSGCAAIIALAGFGLNLFIYHTGKTEIDERLTRIEKADSLSLSNSRQLELNIQALSDSLHKLKDTIHP